MSDPGKKKRAADQRETVSGKVNQTSYGKEHHRDYTALRLFLQEKLVEG